MLDADEGEQAGSNRTDCLAIHLDTGCGHALDQGKHGRGIVEFAPRVVNATCR